MENQNPPIMQNWNLSSNGMDVILKGTVYGHPRINDGRKINTSPLVKGVFSHGNGDEIYFHTHNTIYHCPMYQVDPTCQLTKKYLLETMPQEHDRWDRWLDGDPTRPATPFQGLELPVQDGAYLLALDPERPYIFTGVYQKVGQSYHWIIRNPYVNMGMYTDSVLCNKYDEQLNLLFDVRYFPQGCQQVKFYDIQLKEDVFFYVVNVGETHINYDNNTLEPWHYFQLLEHMVDKTPPQIPNPQQSPPPQEESAPVGEESALVEEESALVEEESALVEEESAPVEDEISSSTDPETATTSLPEEVAEMTEPSGEVAEPPVAETSPFEEIALEERQGDIPTTLENTEEREGEGISIFDATLPLDYVLNDDDVRIYEGDLSDIQREIQAELQEVSAKAEEEIQYPEYPPRTMSLLDEVDQDEILTQKVEEEEEISEEIPEENPEETPEEEAKKPEPVPQKISEEDRTINTPYHIYGSKLEEVPLVPSDGENSLVLPEVLPAMTLEYFPDEGESEVKELKLFPTDGR